MTHFNLRFAYIQVRIFDDVPQDVSIATTVFQGLTRNRASCLLVMMIMNFGIYNAHVTLSRITTRVLKPYINEFVIVYLR